MVEPFGQNFASFSGLARQHVKLRPGPLRVDVIRRDRRNPSPVVDPRCDQPAQHGRRQIGGRLDIHLWPEKQPCCGDGP